MTATYESSASERHDTLNLNMQEIHELDARRAALNLMEDAVHARRELEELNERLRASEERFRRLFESARDGILIVDMKTMRIADANPAMSELVECSREEMLDQELWKIGLFKNRSENEAAIRSLCENGHLHYEELSLRSATGEAREIELIGNLYREGDHVVAQCNIRDITERRQMEQMLESRRGEMAAADRRKDEFLAMLSHELRNPLTPIFNALQILNLDSEGPEAKRESRAVISRQVRQLARLVDDLLEVSRINTGRMRLQLKRIEFNDFVGSTVEAVRSRTDEKDQELALTLPDEPVWLSADPTRLGQIVENLLTNAGKYTEPGGHIRVAVESGDGQAVLRVKDDGIGIAPELLPHMFDLFSQGDVSLDRSQGGLGIGLSLVKTLVELHGGTVAAQSNDPEPGSEFIVRLPLATGAELAEEAENGPDPEGPAASLRILIVDDNVDAAKMTSILLRASGHEIRIAHSGPAALDVAHEFEPQAVLLDIGLPDMDGYEVARQFRKNPQFQGVTLVAVTGYGQESDRQHALQAGFNHHLTKPVEYAELAKLLARRSPVS